MSILELKRNSVANYFLAHELDRIISRFTPEQKAKVREMEKRNLESRNGEAIKS